MADINIERARKAAWTAAWTARPLHHDDPRKGLARHRQHSQGMMTRPACIRTSSFSLPCSNSTPASVSPLSYSRIVSVGICVT